MFWVWKWEMNFMNTIQWKVVLLPVTLNKTIWNIFFSLLTLLISILGASFTNRTVIIVSRECFYFGSTMRLQNTSRHQFCDFFFSDFNTFCLIIFRFVFVVKNMNYILTPFFLQWRSFPWISFTINNCTQTTEKKNTAAIV